MVIWVKEDVLGVEILLCVDDTDSITKETSTGAIAQEIAEELIKLGGVLQDGISRHQLLLDEAIAYTSHNSAMCLAMELPVLPEAQVIACAEQVIIRRKASGSDPGLAICWLAQLEHPQQLLEFGFAAKQRVLSKAEAYALTEADRGLFLEELGGDGSGVIGALSGLGLRLSRCDGTLRGKTGEEWRQQVLSVKELCRRLHVEQILAEDGTSLPEAALGMIETRVKVCFWQGKRSVWSKRREDGIFVLCATHQEVENYHWQQGKSCSDFQWDNDWEETLGTVQPHCLNCLYRRWRKDGYDCIKEKQR